MRKRRSGLSAAGYRRLAHGIFLLLLVVWEAGVRAGLIPALFFPAPSTIIVTLWRSLSDGEMAGHLAATLSRVIAGFLLGGIPGFVLGLFMGWSRSFRKALDPFVAAAHPIPKISIFPLILILFGVGSVSKILVVAIGAFFPVLINTMTGVQQINPIYFEVARNCGADLRRTFSRVVIPGSAPFVLAGARIALNVALTLAIAVELVSAQKGLGAVIWLSWQTLRTEYLYVGIVLAALLGIGFRSLIHVLLLRLTPWQAEVHH
jgi:NitT/TauT family transport system permease protein